MTPKEKAQELIDIFYSLLPDHKNIEYENQSAEKCAMFCTEEILNSQYPATPEIYRYWYDVQIEIKQIMNNNE